MKRMIVICLLLALLLACVPTPEEEYVVNKADQQQMLDLATRTDAPKPDSATAGPEEQATASTAVGLYERLGAPKTYQASLSGTDGRLQVEVDAKVILPECELPIVRVVPKEFTRKEKLALVDALIPADMQIVDTREGVVWQTKGFVAHYIERARWAIDNWDNGGAILYDIDDSTPSDVEKKIQDLLIEQADAPAESPKLDRNGALPNSVFATKDEMNFLSLYFSTNPWDGTVHQIDYERNFFDNPNVPTKQIRANDLLQRDAEEAANALLEKLPFGGFALSAAWPETYFDDYDRNIPCWRLLYTRSVNGAQETATNYTETINSEYNHYRGNEILLITVDADGVVGLRYRTPYEVSDIVAEQTNLLPFEKIEEIFKRYILVYKNNLNDGTRDKTYWTYHITTVRLGLVNIPEENSDAGLLVPAWDFMGYQHFESPYENDDAWTNELMSFLTINAIDGSIIEREGSL